MDYTHTYLICSGLWELDGLIEGSDGNKFKQEGQLAVYRQDDSWSIDSRITILRPAPQDIVSRYEVTSFNEEAGYAEWTSHVGGPEPVHGLFVIVEDTIMSPWQSSGGEYWGQEVLVQVTEDEYRVRGFAFLKRNKVSAWSARMFRIT